LRQADRHQSRRSGRCRISEVDVDGRCHEVSLVRWVGKLDGMNWCDTGGDWSQASDRFPEALQGPCSCRTNLHAQPIQDRLAPPSLQDPPDPFHLSPSRLLPEGDLAVVFWHLSSALRTLSTPAIAHYRTDDTCCGAAISK
jgi:hypothetical protein